ncbi:MAG: hypothetical protein NTU49_00310, partial [Gammaproteobacteria bacterium]|nr:hypothetical protein [Gammaproteobacteria bacterium]
MKNANLTGAKLTAKQLIAVFEKATLAESKKLNDYKIDFLETFVEPNDIPVLCKLINARKLIMPLIKALDGKRYIVLDASKNVTVADLKAYISDLKSLDVVKTYLGEVVLPKINDPEYGVDNLPLDNLPLYKDKEHSQNKDTTYTMRECWAFMGRSEAPSLNGVKITGSAMATPEEDFFFISKDIQLENHVDFTGADFSMADFQGEYAFLARIVTKYKDVIIRKKKKKEVDKNILDLSKLSDSSFFKGKELPVALSQIIVIGKAVSELTLKDQARKIEDILDFTHADLSHADFSGQNALLSRIVEKYPSVKRSWEQVLATEKNFKVGFSYLE